MIKIIEIHPQVYINYPFAWPSLLKRSSAEVLDPEDRRGKLIYFSNTVQHDPNGSLSLNWTYRLNLKR